LLEKEYDLRELLENPDRPLTKYEWDNFGNLYMRMTNDDKSAADVDIAPEVNRRVEEIKKRGTYWR